MIDTQKIFKTKQEIQKLLRERPELAELQLKIDRAMERAGRNTNNRMVILSGLLKDSIDDMVKIWRRVR